MAAPVWATNDVPTATDFNNWLQNIRFARRTSIASITSSTTMTSDSQLTLPVDANSTYHLDMLLLYDGATAGDLKFQLIVPSGAAFLGAVHGLISTAASQQDYQGFPLADTTPAVVGALGGTIWCRVEGLVVVSATSGSATLQWAQNTSSGTSTRILVNSFLRLTRVE